MGERRREIDLHWPTPNMKLAAASAPTMRFVRYFGAALPRRRADSSSIVLVQRACANDSVRGPVRACSFKAPNFSSRGGAAAKVAPRLPPRLKLGAAAARKC